MQTTIACALLALHALCSACTGMRGPAVGAASMNAGAVPVRVIHDGTRYVLLRGGVPYKINGAGIEYGSIAAFAAHGGTSFRTWRTDNAVATGQQVLDEAARHGLTVLMCIEIGRERHGFDYDDEKAVARELEYARGEVLKYKDHPALLAWMIGNEPDLRFRNPRVFDAINDISRMIHEVDPNHPTTTALSRFDTTLAALIESRAPDLDFISIQTYADIVNLPRHLAAASFTGPYMVTEWGTIGHWEVSQTSWGSPVEQSSSDKARSYRKAYEAALAAGDNKLLGAYVFLWGQKQERTPTWYGMFLKDGSATEAVDLMQFIWTGKWPANRSPQVDGMTLDGKAGTDNIVVAPGQRLAARVIASDPEGDELRYVWEVFHEINPTQDGGDDEPMPPRARLHMDGASSANPFFTAPRKPGAYRIFVYVHDGAGRAGHANIPFYVSSPGVNPPHPPSAAIS